MNFNKKFKMYGAFSNVDNNDSTLKMANADIDYPPIEMFSERYTSA